MDEKLLKKQYLYNFFMKIVPDYDIIIIDDIFKEYSKIHNFTFDFDNEKIQLKIGDKSVCYCGSYFDDDVIEEKHIILCKIQSYLYNIKLKKMNQTHIICFTFKEFTENDFNLNDNDFLDILYYSFKKYDIIETNDTIKSYDKHLINYFELQCEINKLKDENNNIKNNIQKLQKSIIAIYDMIERDYVKKWSFCK